MKLRPNSGLVEFQSLYFFSTEQCHDAIEVDFPDLLLRKWLWHPFVNVPQFSLVFILYYIYTVVQTLYTTIIICYSQGEGQGSFIQTFFTGPKLAKNTFSLPLDGPKSGQVLCKNPYLEKSRSEFQTSQSSILFIQSSEKNLSPMKNLSLNYFLVGHPANFPENSGFSAENVGGLTNWSQFHFCTCSHL